MELARMIKDIILVS